MTNIYYTYVLLNPLVSFEGYDGKPFYVGKGKGNRAFDHLRSNNFENLHKTIEIKAIRKAGSEPAIFFYKKSLAETEAFQLEIDLISLWGRRGRDPGGILTNIFPGGNAPIVWSGVPKSETHKAKLSKARMGQKDSDETRKRKAKPILV